MDETLSFEDRLRGLLNDEGSPDGGAQDADAHVIEWAEFWAKDHHTQEWAIFPLIPKGRQVAIYAPAKAGKSVVLLAAIVAAVQGRSAFGSVHHAPEEPVTVLYLDYEMTEDDLHERLRELGLGPGTDLSHFHYALLPSLPPLDTAEGAKAVEDLCDRYMPDVVIVDTFGRAVAGEENSADTVRGYYRHTGMMLKTRGIASARTDHTGKDPTKGQRGTSAKVDDVDVVWELGRTDDGSRLKRTHSRVGWVPHDVNLVRTLTGLENDADRRVVWEMMESKGYLEGTAEAAAWLDGMGVPVEGRDRVKAWLKAKGITHETDANYPPDNVLRDVIRYRKQRPDGLLISATPGPTPGPTPTNASDATPGPTPTHANHETAGQSARQAPTPTHANDPRCPTPTGPLFEGQVCHPPPRAPLTMDEYLAELDPESTHERNAQ